MTMSTFRIFSKLKNSGTSIGLLLVGLGLLTGCDSFQAVTKSSLSSVAKDGESRSKYVAPTPQNYDNMTYIGSFDGIQNGKLIGWACNYWNMAGYIGNQIEVTTEGRVMYLYLMIGSGKTLVSLTGGSITLLKDVIVPNVLADAGINDLCHLTNGATARFEVPITPELMDKYAGEEINVGYYVSRYPTGGSAGDPLEALPRTGYFTVPANPLNPANAAVLVTQSFRKIFQREPDAYALNAWVANLLNGYTVAQMEDSFRRTAAARAVFARQITDIFHATLRREPDAYSLDAWISNMINGYTVDQVLAAFRQSDEARTLVYHDQITQVYRSVLQRDPEAYGLNAWTQNMFAGWTIEQVQAAISQSDEALTLPFKLQITDAYHTYLQREPDVYGMTAWITNMKNGYTYEQMRSAFRHTDEARAVFKNQIAAIYLKVLKRQPDSYGLEAWITNMVNGYSVDQVEQAFRQCSEAQALAAAGG